MDMQSPMICMQIDTYLFLFLFFYKILLMHKLEELTNELDDWSVFIFIDFLDHKRQETIRIALHNLSDILTLHFLSA